MKRECETCIKRKTPYCPTSIDCMATDDMPYYQNRIMLLEENQELKKQLEETKTNYEQEKYIVDKQTRQLTDEYKNTEHQTNKVEELKNQQKEFIEYLEKEKERCLTFYSSTQCMYAYDVFKDVLSKYKKIIGGKE